MCSSDLFQSSPAPRMERPARRSSTTWWVIQSTKPMPPIARRWKGCLPNTPIDLPGGSCQLTRPSAGSFFTRSNRRCCKLFFFHYNPRKAHSNVTLTSGETPPSGWRYQQAQARISGSPARQTLINNSTRYPNERFSFQRLCDSLRC